MLVRYYHRRVEEPVLQEIAEVGVVTRNRYNARILNSSNVMFLDWDLPFIKPAPISFWQQMLSGVSVSFRAKLEAEERVRVEGIRTAQRPELLEQIRADGKHLGLGLRLYATAGGFRGLVTSACFDPSDDLSQEVMQALKVDKLYTRLCRIQGTFRARLSPKPWRLRCPPRANHKPISLIPNTEEAQWLTLYDLQAKRFAVCHFLEQMGEISTEAPIQATIAFHDSVCCAALPLA